jgi:hypothetical protein
MTPQTISFDQWRSQQATQRAKSASLVEFFGQIRRDKPRDRVEAQFLRRIGTPERLIGPSS